MAVPVTRHVLGGFCSEGLLGVVLSGAWCSSGDNLTIDFEGTVR